MGGHFVSLEVTSGRTSECAGVGGVGVWRCGSVKESTRLLKKHTIHPQGIC